MKTTEKVAKVLLWVAGFAILSGCASTVARKDVTSLVKSSNRLGVSVHDPSIVRDGDKYYIFGSHMDAAVSDDLTRWTMFASGATKYNKLFDNLFTDLKAFDFVGRNDQGSYSVWAPDVMWVPEMGKWLMYFCVSSTYIKSNLCFATADSVTGPYHYQDTVIYSGFTALTIDKTNVESIVGAGNGRKYLNFSAYKNTLWPNAIDPALFRDAENRLWMVYGSWSGGIFQLELDPSTGYPIHPAADEAAGVDPYFGRHLEGGWHNSIEGPYVLYDRVSDWYYLFVSYGSLVSNGGYQIRLFRSKTPEGPFLDAKGESVDYMKATHWQYGVKLMGNYRFPGQMTAYMAPGHNSAMIDDSGNLFLVHHVRFDDGTEYHEPRVRRLFRTADGWLAAAPFSYDGAESPAAGMTRREASGYFWVVNHGLKISGDIVNAEEALFAPDGSVRDSEGKKAGSWTYDGKTGNGTVTLGDESFVGVFVRENDEGGNPTLSFTGVSPANEALWAVRY